MPPPVLLPISPSSRHGGRVKGVEIHSAIPPPLGPAPRVGDQDAVLRQPPNLVAAAAEIPGRATDVVPALPDLTYRDALACPAFEASQPITVLYGNAITFLAPIP